MKTIEKKYYVCEICGKTAQDPEKIRDCQREHHLVDDMCTIAHRFTKGGRFPRQLTITFPDGAVAVYGLAKADLEGLLVTLPCKGAVYIIVEDHFACDACEHGKAAKYRPRVDRVSCDIDDCHCPRHIEERRIEGFEVMVDKNGNLTLSAPGVWGHEGLETFSGSDGKWYFARAEAEAALAGGDGDG